MKRALIMLQVWIAALFWAPAALAAAGPATCHVASDLSGDLAQLAASAAGWKCAAGPPTIEADRVAIRLPVDLNGPAPQLVLVHREILQEMHVAAVGPTGEVATASWREGEDGLFALGRDNAMPIPALEGRPAFVVAVFDRPTSADSLSTVRTARARDGLTHEEAGRAVVLSLLAGMLLLPVVFNLACYRVLRESFVLWHVGFTLMLFTQILVESGLSEYLVTLRPDILARIDVVSIGLAIAGAGMFARSFIEPGRMNPVLRRALGWSAALAVCLVVMHAFFPYFLRSIQPDLYNLGFVPILATYIAAVIDALRRGSRAATFLLAAWLPMFLVSAVRIVTHAFDALPNNEMMALFYVGIGIDVVASALGVADRFMIIKRQRDRATAHSQVLEQLADRDPLTGLLNRRTIEARFGQLQREGFDTMALLDLDRFKEINDRFGHQGGDAVLRACADALRGDDRDHIVIRFGGEEFMLLLRGKRSVARAEALRRSLPGQIAASVAGLDRSVTASMGVVEIPKDGLQGIGFAALYARADRLLYEAKAAGRNRSFHERVRVFETAPPGREEQVQAA